ncbi:MAG: nicotinate (nicotinamide) nucleotide adenylyltransferase [Chloroflexota bacterium]
MERIGVLGGSFDPPHIGHRYWALAAAKQLELDLVLWVPTQMPPHKLDRVNDQDRGVSLDPLSAIEHRIEMVQLAVDASSIFEFCRTDVDRPGPQYTVDLMRSLTMSGTSSDHWWFLLGEDSLRDLHLWREPSSIIELCRLAVLPRPDIRVDWHISHEMVPGLGARIDWIEGELVDVSSHDIRQRIRGGEPYRYLLDPRVANFIEDSGLYLKQP